ncbi:MAG TPA: ASKHA domain-containing protein, partial [Longimicrobiales bacterium]
DSIVLAGAFGNYIIPDDALRIGLLPDVPVERVGFASDAALAGAQLLVTSASARARAAAVASRARYVELGGHHGYSDAFVEEIPFPSARGRLLAGLSQLTTDMTLQSLQRCPYRAAFDVCTFRGPCRNRIRVQPRSSRCGGGPLNRNPV